MAATPEEFLGQGGFLADPEPFSPSIFLNLPLTPRPDGEDLASSDDLVQPFISRMLMEEDIDDKYPDNPALLTAQQPFAQILSDTATAFSSDAATINGCGTFTLSPSSSDAPTFANATWPYDPVELSQLLLSPPYRNMGVGLNGFTADDVSQLFLPEQDGASAGFHQIVDEASAFLNGGGAAIQSSGFLDGAEEETITTLPAADGEHGALASAFFSSQHRVNMDMLNLAFLKGMEEAKKFLPTNNSLLIDLEATSREHLPGDGKLSRVFAAGQLKKGVVDGMSMFPERGNSRGRKNKHNWDDLEAEAGRNSKVMVPEPGETGEMVDKMIINVYDMCLEKMKGLRITMGREAEKNTRKGNGKLAQGRQSSNEAVDLSTLLIHCAQAVSMDDRRSATELLLQIKQHSSPGGDANQRLAHCFAEGLEARLAGTGSTVCKSLMTKRTSVVELLKAHQLYLAACCFRMTAYRFSNMTICKAIAGRKKVHIVDYGEQYGFQWTSLLALFATWECGPPEVRITSIVLSQPGLRPADPIEETGRRLSNCARQFGVSFKFRSIVVKWDMVRVDDLNIDPDEVLIVNSIIQFGNLMDEGIDIYSPSPRDVVLSNIQKMRPDVFILCVLNGSCSVPFFVTRFREALFYYSAMFDMLDATAPRDCDERLLVERDLIRRCALNVIACEGSDRVERPETYKQWQVRNHRARLRQLPLYPDIVEMLREKVKNQYHKDFVIDVDHQWFLQGWKGRILYAMSTWVADEAISEL
ncbi:scarecrow-like protein 34 [Phragmites australis]|uniref:scarecrow-like protein 34 n=1 Tax=Phragmites australis TaxID=29695 RepID=UPI002D76F459|nr:scarecrow-like protein 34 [Phragmites australis]